MLIKLMKNAITDKGVRVFGKIVAKRSMIADNVCETGIGLPKWFLLTQSASSVLHGASAPLVAGERTLFWETRLEARLYAALPRSFLYTSKLFDWICNEASQLSSVSLIKFGIGGPPTTQGTQSILGPLNTAKFEKISGKQYFMHISTEEYFFNVSRERNGWNMPLFYFCMFSFISI